MEERVLVEGVANQINGLFVGQGHGVLTNKRFIYSKHGFAKTLVMGAFVNLTKGSYDYDIAREDIKSIEVGKVRLGSGLIITKNNGEVLRYGILKAVDWKIAVDNFLSEQNERVSNNIVTSKNFCPNCGVKVENNVNFCPNCGNKI